MGTFVDLCIGLIILGGLAALLAGDITPVIIIGAVILAVGAFNGGSRHSGKR
jgi:hypothetical protein